jgi:hypothetical protein
LTPFWVFPTAFFISAMDWRWHVRCEKVNALQKGWHQSLRQRTPRKRGLRGC